MIMDRLNEIFDSRFSDIEVSKGDYLELKRINIKIFSL